MCCTRLAGNAGPKKIAILAPSCNFVGYIFTTKAHIDNQKNLLSSNISSTRPYNMVNFGILAANWCPKLTIVSLVWGTPSNINGFRVLAALLHGTPVLGVSQTLRP